jgi:hypothetical protein
MVFTCALLARIQNRLTRSILPATLVPKPRSPARDRLACVEWRLERREARSRVTQGWRMDLLLNKTACFSSELTTLLFAIDPLAELSP